MIQKDEQKLKKWVGLALKKAIKNGLKRYINVQEVFQFLLDSKSSTTRDEDKDIVVDYTYKMLMDFEKICRFIEKEKIPEKHLSMIHKYVVF